MIEIKCNFDLNISFKFPEEKCDNASAKKIMLDIQDMAKAIKEMILEDAAVSEYGTVYIKLMSYSIENRG